MILGDCASSAAAPAIGANHVSIDEIFRRMARRRPDALALADPPNRMAFTAGAPRRLSYAEADRAVNAIAGRLRQMGLPADAIVGIQLPNIAENVLTILGVMRAGMIAAPVPLLWRHADTIAALARLGAKVLVTIGHVGAFNHGQLALRVAAEVFSIRYVCGFGADLPDGVVSFDDLIAAESLDTPPLDTPPFDRERRGDAAAHVAAITFEVGEAGVVAVARDHLELLAGGLGVLLESGLPQDATVISTLGPSSFAGIGLTLLPWILCGGTLLLHHPFDPRLLASQWQTVERDAAVILPGPVAFCLAEAGMFTRQAPAHVLATWRAPDRLEASPAWPERDTDLVDIAIFGEAGLVAARRDPDGRPAPLPFGPIAAPRGGADAVMIAEVLQSRRGTLAMRGPMVPHHSFPPGVERAGQSYFEIAPGGLVDTGYPCRVDPGPMLVAVTGPPSDIVSVGGSRIALPDLQDVVRRLDAHATLTALPDPLLGQRLIGSAGDCCAVRAALNAAGVNPLVVAAFADRGDRDVSLPARAEARR